MNNQLGAIMESFESKEFRTEAVDLSFGEILSLFQNKEIIIRPEYQRLLRWTDEQRSRLIESILLRLPISPIFFIEKDNGVLELIDGLQRTSSVLQFLDHKAVGQDELVLQGCDILKDINGNKFGDFSTSIRLSLKSARIRAVIVKCKGDEHVKYEMFKRLNTGGFPASAQEIRNFSSRMSSGGAQFHQILQELAADQNFKTAIDRMPQRDRDRLADEELVLRFFAVCYYRNEFSGNVREWLDNFMEDVLFFKRTDAKLDPDAFKNFFAFVANQFGNAAFSPFPNGEACGWLVPTYFDAVTGALAERFEELENAPAEELKGKLREAFEREEFKDAGGPSANSKCIMEQRIRCVRTTLLSR